MVLFLLCFVMFLTKCWCFSCNVGDFVVFYVIFDEKVVFFHKCWVK